MDVRKQAIPVFTTIAVVVGVGVILQLWLLSASLEAVLTGRTSVAVAGTGASAFLFAINGGLFLYLLRVDRRTRAAR